jgi:hypothetical protein
MLRNLIAAIAAAAVVAAPAAAAELPRYDEQGARRSGAAATAYFRIPLGGPRDKAPRAGLKLAMLHDYRDARAQTARVIEAETFDLRLTGHKNPTLYVAGRPVTGAEARKQNLGPVNTAVTVVVLVAAVVGVYYISRAVSDSGDE